MKEEKVIKKDYRSGEEVITDVSDEIDKCLEHALDCICNIDPVLMSAATMIARNISESQISLGLDVIRKANLIEEFNQFCIETKVSNIFDAMNKFAKLHPDKFYVPDQTEIYGHFIMMDNRK